MQGHGHRCRKYKQEISELLKLLILTCLGTGYIQMHVLFAFHLLPTMCGIHCCDNVLQFEDSEQCSQENMPSIRQAKRKRKLTRAVIKINESPVISVSFRASLHGDECGMFEGRDLLCCVSWFGLCPYLENMKMGWGEKQILMLAMSVNHIWGELIEWPCVVQERE